MEIDIPMFIDVFRPNGDRNIVLVDNFTIAVLDNPITQHNIYLPYSPVFHNYCNGAGALFSRMVYMQGNDGVYQIRLVNFEQTPHNTCDEEHDDEFIENLLDLAPVMTKVAETVQLIYATSGLISGYWAYYNWLADVGFPPAEEVNFGDADDESDDEIA